MAIPLLDLKLQYATIRDEALRVTSEIYESQLFILGKRVEDFERDFAAYCRTSHAIGVSSGTDALLEALMVLGVSAGDEVIMPAHTFFATAGAVARTGATPVFVDIDLADYNIDPKLIEAKITGRTKAIIPVHLYGQPAPMDEILDLAAAHDLPVIEDAAQAVGADYKGRRIGSIGLMGCFSFFPSKNLGAFGDAGAIVTSDAGLTERLRSIRDHGRMQGDHGHYQHGVLGLNSRLDGVQAVVLSAKLRRIDAWNQARRELMAEYRRLIDPAKARLVAELPGGQGVHHLAVAQVNDRDRVREELGALGIGTGIHYPVPCHLMVPYTQYADGPMPVAEAAANRQLSLPMFPHLSIDDVRRVAATLNAVAVAR
jgi:dTDP-4-amino-4,6-dideoxygalactose transaminase